MSLLYSNNMRPYIYLIQQIIILFIFSHLKLCKILYQNFIYSSFSETCFIYLTSVFIWVSNGCSFIKCFCYHHKYLDPVQCSFPLLKLILMPLLSFCLHVPGVFLPSHLFLTFLYTFIFNYFSYEHRVLNFIPSIL